MSYSSTDIKYKSIEIPEKESFYSFDVYFPFNDIYDCGALIVWSQENIDSIYSPTKLSQKVVNKEFERYIRGTLRISHGVFS